jgi:hypothetical protein
MDESESSSADALREIEREWIEVREKVRAALAKLEEVQREVQRELQDANDELDDS